MGKGSIPSSFGGFQNFYVLVQSVADTNKGFFPQEIVGEGIEPYPNQYFKEIFLLQVEVVFLISHEKAYIVEKSMDLGPLYTLDFLD